MGIKVIAVSVFMLFQIALTPEQVKEPETNLLGLNNQKIELAIKQAKEKAKKAKEEKLRKEKEEQERREKEEQERLEAQAREEEEREQEEREALAQKEQEAQKSSSKSTAKPKEEAKEASTSSSERTLIGIFRITAYCTEKYSHICGGGAGITASGAPVTAGTTIAVDPSVIPLGSRVYIEGIGERIAQDTGGVVNGYILDLALPTHSEALNFGVQSRKVYLID